MKQKNTVFKDFTVTKYEETCKDNYELLRILTKDFLSEVFNETDSIYLQYQKQYIEGTAYHINLYWICA